MLPKLVSIGSFYIPAYGVLVALAFLAGLGITLRLARRVGLSPEKITNLAVYCAIAGIVGAKLFMFLFDIGFYIHNPGQIFTLETLQAAGVFHGGFIVALLTAVLYMRRQELPAWLTMLRLHQVLRLDKRSAASAVSLQAAAGVKNAICLGASTFDRTLPRQCR